MANSQEETQVKVLAALVDDGAFVKQAGTSINADEGAWWIRPIIAGAIGGASITVPITTAVPLASLITSPPDDVLGFALSIPGAGHPVIVGDSAGHGITLTPNGADVLTWEAPSWMHDFSTVYVVATGGAQAVGVVWGTL